MKIKLSLVCAMLFGIACHAQTTKLPSDEIAKYTNSVVVTKNIIFFLASEGSPATEFKSDELIDTGLAQTPISLTTTNIIWLYWIPYEQTFDFHLFDKSGQEVQKTKLGITMSQPANPTKYGRSMKDHLLGRDVSNLLFKPIKNNEDYYHWFRPDDLFIITNKGIYNLSISMRICVPMTNGVVDTNALTDWRAFARARTFGVVESPPLYVKVIKE